MHRICKKICESDNARSYNVHPLTKPDWVKAVVLDLHTTLPQAGCRSLANQFNAIHADFGFKVSKNWVSDLLKRRGHALALTRKRSAVARSEPIQRVWGIDLTGLPLKSGESLPVWCVIDHGSRTVLQLDSFAKYNSLILLGKLLVAFGAFGIPNAIRSDNDAMFKTWTFRLMLRLLGVNPRRFREVLRILEEQMRFTSIEAMSDLHNSFQDFYNFSRQHQSLSGQTPAQVWQRQIAEMHDASG